MKFVYLLALSVSLFAQEIVVIANSHMKPLSQAEIRGVFLRKIRIIDGVAVVPLNLEASNPLRQAFRKHLLHMSLPQAQHYWMRQHYLGHRPPLSKHSQKSIKEFVKKIEGGIGYIEASKLEDGVQVLYRWKVQQ